MTIKVCHVTSMHRVFDTRIFHKECASLSKKYEVYLVASNVDSQIVDGIHIVGVKMPPHGLRKMLTTKPIIKAALAIDADVYHFHDPELISAGLKMKKEGKKVVFDYHENYTDFLLTKDWIPKPLRHLAKHFFSKFERKYLAQYDAVVSVTPFIIKRLEKYNSNVYQITNYPKLQEVEDNRQWGQSVCFVGGIVPEWMHYNIVKSLSETSAVYRLAGAYHPASYFNQLQACEEWKSVEYHGKIPYSEVMPFMQQSSAGLAIRTYDDPNVGYKEGSLGVNKFFEYMMVGIPVIASASEVWRDIINKYECGILVDPYSPTSIAQAINFVIEHPEDAKRMGDNAHDAAVKHYHWGTQEDILFQMYERLLNG